VKDLIAGVRARLRRLGAIVLRPVLERIYLRVDMRTVAALRAARSAQAADSDDLAQTLELARSSAASSATAARELRREHEQLSARLQAVEQRLAELDARSNGRASSA
jgi:hypothetical protein